MTIDYVIPGATLLDQLAPAAIDGLPPVDANDNCVPTSIAEGLHILTGRTFDGDELHDAVYGAGYLGPQSASHYVAYCASQGVTLAAHDGAQSDLIATIHSEVSAGHPVVVTMPSQWGTAPADPVHPNGSTHVGVAVGVGSGEIRVMNPWHSFFQDESDAWWQARLCYGQVWPMVKAAGVSMSGVPSGWSDDGVTLTGAPAPDGKRYQCGHGIRAFVLANNWYPGDVPITPEEDVPSVEQGNASIGPGARQFFLESGEIGWTQTMNTYRVWQGQEEVALHKALESAAAATLAAQAAEASAQSQAASLQSQLTASQAAEAQAAQNLTAAQQAQQTTTQNLTAAQAQIDSLKAQVAQLQSQPAPAPTPAPTPAPVPVPVANPAPTTPAACAALLVQLIAAELAATMKAATPAS